MAIIVRKASPEDALSACEVLRRSIRELCGVDHKNDEKAVAEWLENKTPENVRRWLESPHTFGVVAEHDGTVCGFAMVGRDGTISLCYVVPEAHHSGAGKKMLAELEAQAMRWKLASLRLESTLTAKPFYERNGYASTGEPVAVTGSQGGYPLQKVLAL
jgi:ribosomal protein S18 acetylase RimI-like enzyme